MNFKLFLTFLLGLFGFDIEPETPARLDKRSRNDDHNNFSQMADKTGAWMTRHASFCLLVLILIFALIFTAACYALIGVSAVESGGLRNFMNGGMV